MTNVQLIHNPFLCKTEIRINDELFTNTSSLFKYRNTPMRDWVLTFLPDLVESCNDDKISINFCGLQFNCDELEKQVHHYNQNNRDVDITLEHEVSRSSESRMGELSGIINDINRNKYLRTEESDEDIIRSNRYILELVVISSDDKARIQVINDLIGQSLLKLNSERGSKITDSDRNNYFEAEADEQEDMFAIIKGNIPFVDSKHTQLMITDTTNSERLDDYYYRYIKKAITDSEKPMILFVIDCNLSMNNEEFLIMIAEQYNQKGMQNKERFIFIADNPNSAKKYLVSEFAIKNALVYPLDDILLIQEKIQKYISEYCMIQKVLNVTREIEETLNIIKECVEKKAENDNYEEIKCSAKKIEIEVSKLKVECCGLMQLTSIRENVAFFILKLKQSFKEVINGEEKFSHMLIYLRLHINMASIQFLSVFEKIKQIVENGIENFIRNKIQEQCSTLKYQIYVDSSIDSLVERMGLNQELTKKFLPMLIREIPDYEIEEISNRAITEAKNAINSIEVAIEPHKFRIDSMGGKIVKNSDGREVIVYKFYEGLIALIVEEICTNVSPLKSSQLLSCIKVFDSNIVIIKPILEEVLNKAVIQVQEKYIIDQKALEKTKADIINQVNNRLEEFKNVTQISISEQEKLNYIDDLLVSLSDITEL